MISVIIPTLIRNKDQEAMTYRCIEAAKTKTKIPFETVIVETESNLLQNHSDIHIWERNKSTSGKSINRGFNAASGSFVVLLTNDVIVDENWLDHLIQPFEVFEDCGISTLACDQLKHNKRDEIKEGVWFGLAMLPKEEAWFDELYDGSWDDSDLIMRVYLKGRKMYRNYKSVVHHKPGQTMYQDPNHQVKYLQNREYFTRKFMPFKQHKMYQALVGGLIL